MPLNLVVSHSSQFYGQYGTSFIALVAMVGIRWGTTSLANPSPSLVACALSKYDFGPHYPAGWALMCNRCSHTCLFGITWTVDYWST